jgi:hypothetical protein
MSPLRGSDRRDSRITNRIACVFFSVPRFRPTCGTHGKLLSLSLPRFRFRPRAKVGDAILEPGRVDCGVDPADKVVASWCHVLASPISFPRPGGERVAEGRVRGFALGYRVDFCSRARWW